MLLINACPCSSSCSLSRMTWISFGSCSTLKPPWTQQQQQRPDPVSDNWPDPLPTHRHSQVWSHRLFEIPAADLRAPRQKGPNRLWTYMQTKALLRRKPSARANNTRGRTECELACPGESEWSSNVEERWLVTAEQSGSFNLLCSQNVLHHHMCDDMCHRSSDWCYEAFVCKSNSCKIWGVKKKKKCQKWFFFFVAHWRQSEYGTRQRGMFKWYMRCRYCKIVNSSIFL